MAEKAKKESASKVSIDRIDHARLVAGNGVTFFARFNKATKACSVSIGDESDSSFVVSFDAMRAFARLVNKYTRKGG